MITSKISYIWDRIGIGISIACLTHCLLVPVVLTILPFWSFRFLSHDWVHLIFLAFILPTVFLALRRKKSNRRVMFLLLSGLSILGLAWLLHHWWGRQGELVMTSIGSLILIWGHWCNYLSHKNHLAKKINKKKPHNEFHTISNG